MNRIPLIVLVSGVLLMAAVWFGTRSPAPSGAPRLEALAAELSELRAEREDLLQRLEKLEAGLAAASVMSVYATPEAEIQDEGLSAVDADVEDGAEQVEEPVPAAQARIVEAGLNEEEYASMRQRAQALYLENFESEWRQRREAYLANGAAPDSRDQLRYELGDDAYDRYLYASGRPNRVRVRRVMSGSAAAAAGITEGDVLLSYDGERLFQFDDLREASYQGEPGDTVLLEVRRADGTVAQMVIPRGPMGISGYGGWRETPGS